MQHMRVSIGFECADHFSDGYFIAGEGHCVALQHVSHGVIEECVVRHVRVLLAEPGGGEGRELPLHEVEPTWSGS